VQEAMAAAEEQSGAQTPGVAEALVLDLAGLATLLERLRASGHDLVGPTLRDGAIILDEIQDLADLPAGWRDEQEAGRYRLVRREDEALFGHVVGPVPWKRWLFPPRTLLWRAWRRDGGFTVEQPPPEERRLALLGVRGCDLAALRVLDRVFLEGEVQDRTWKERRQRVFLVAVDCGLSAPTCFCTAMGAGPAAGEGADLVLTELLDATRHEFLLRAASPRGEAMLEDLPGRPPEKTDHEAARAAVAGAAAAQGRQVETDGLPDLLTERLRHPRWTEVADRCLGCANCTMVCPTCFCSTVEEVTDLQGTTAERWRRWASCFDPEHSYIHGGSIRTSIRERYRQWLTHKFGTWVAQFGVSGCTGCGRCITWCPAGIDVTEELQALRTAAPPAGRS